jgi:hypothetical protein
MRLGRAASSGSPRRRASKETRLPRTRSEAFRFWMLAIATTALVETALVALGAAFPSAAAHGEGGRSTLRILAIASALPISFLVFGRVAEIKYQRRPSKAFQVWQFSFYLSGTALVSAGFLRRQANLDPATPLLTAGEILLGAAACLFAAWIASVILCTPSEDALLPIP